MKEGISQEFIFKSEDNETLSAVIIDLEKLDGTPPESINILPNLSPFGVAIFQEIFNGIKPYLPIK